MTAIHGFPTSRPCLHPSEQQKQELRAGIGSDRIPADARMRALQELARFSSDLNSLLLDVIRTESR